MLKRSLTTGQRQRKSAQNVSQTSPGQRFPQGSGVSVPDRREGPPTFPRRRQEVCACADRPAEHFSFPPGAAHFLLDVSKWGPRRAPRGGERRSAQAHGVGAEVPLGCKGAGAVFALGPPPRPARWGEPEQRSERVLVSMAGTRDAELVTARETELSGLCDDDNGGRIPHGKCPPAGADAPEANLRRPTSAPSQRPHHEHDQKECILWQLI